jgi:signal transduction histidine kinase
VKDCLSDISAWERIPVEASHVLDLVPDFVGIADRDGRLLFVNHPGRLMVGLEPGEELSRFMIHDFFPNWEISALDASSQAPAGNGNGNRSRWTDWNTNGRLRRRDGREIRTAHAVIAHTGGDSEIACFTIIARGAFAPREDEISVEPIKIDAVVGESIAVARTSLPQTVNIEELFNCDDTAVLANPTQIHQLVMNLCLNSAQSMREDGGRIFVNTTRVTVKGPHEPGGTALRAGNYVRLTIRDNGPGLEPAIATHVFDPVAGTSHEGVTGYGLWNVKRTVVSSGGDIFIETAPGRGTAFHVYMPRMGANGNGSGL